MKLMKVSFDLIFSSRISHIFLLVLTTSVVFSNTLENDYHFDSIFRVKTNTEIDRFWPPLRFFTDKRTGSTVSQIAEYRPMMPLSHSINSEIAKATGTDRLAGFHVGNVVIHIGSVILVYYLFIFLFGNWGRRAEPETIAAGADLPALAGALIFAIHPISGSAVNYIAARDLLLMVFFFLAFLLIYVRMRRNGDSLAGWIFSLLFLVFAILSKPNAIMAFGLIFLFEWILMKGRLSDWKLWVRTALVGVPTAAYFLLHKLWIADDQINDSALRTVNELEYPLTMLDAHLFYYLRNFVWPFEMRALASVDKVTSVFQPTAFIGLCFIVGSLVIAWWFRKQQALISFAILVYWLLFSLTASIFPFRFVVIDYRQYLPLVFLVLLISALVYYANRKIVSLSVISFLVIYFSASSYYLNTHWKTEESYWQQSVKYGAVAVAHQNYALLISGRDPELAESHYLEALRQTPHHIYANINLGLLHIRMGKESEGLARLKKMASWNPNWALAHYWLSEGLKRTGNEAEALTAIVRAADLDKRSLEYQYDAGRALQKAGNHSQAIPFYERIMQINPAFKDAGFWQAYAHQKAGHSQQAIAAYQRFLQSIPAHVQGHFNLGYEFMTSNNCQKAVAHFHQVLALNPAYREAHLHLSTCYESMGNASQAAAQLSLYKDTGRD